MSARKKETPPKEDFLSSLSTRSRHIIALAVLFILPVILYSPTILGGERYLAHDALQWRAGAESVIDYRETHGEEPLWATNMFSGMPAYVISVQAAVPHLDDIVFGLFESLYPAAPYWVLLGGLYLLFWMMGARPLLAALGALLFAFTTYLPIIIGAGHNAKVLALAWVPWVLTGAWLILRTDRKWLGLFTLAVTFTLHMRAGHPQVTYYFLYLLFFWWIYEGARAYREHRTAVWGKSTAMLAAGGVLGLLGTLQKYWRLAEYSPYSIRGGSALEVGSGGLNLEYAFNWSQGVAELLTLVIPGLFGGASSEAYWGPKSVTSGPHYMGAVVIVLALFGIFYYRKRIKYLFLGTGVLTALFSLGYHFPALNEFMFHYVPYFNKFRTPEMWLIVTVFCFCVLAVFGVLAIFEKTREAKQNKSLRTLLIPLALPLGLAIIFTVGSDALLDYEKPGERRAFAEQLAQQNNLSPENDQVQLNVTRYINNQLKPQRKEMASSDSLRFLILVLLAGALIWAYYDRRIGKGWFLAGLIVLGSYDMLSVGSRYLAEDAMAPESTDLEQALQRQQRPQDRFMMNNVASGEGWDYRVFPATDNPFNNAIPAYFYPSIGGYTGAKLSYYQDVIENALYTGPQGLNMGLLDLLNVKYISVGANQQLPMPNLTLAFSDQNGRVYENTDVLPKAFFVDSVITVSSPQEAIDYLKTGSGIDLGETAVVETSQALVSRPDTSASVEVTSYGPREITLRTSSSGEGFLVLSEIYYPPGWTATVDGQQTEIYKTDYILRGLQVPAGEHEIRLRFDPASYIWGSRISWIGNLLQWGLGIVLLAGWWRGRTSSRDDEKT
ncbi:MAG: YfhO family protein [Balneolaceae bacterium]|nr:YfhO family protein [Balneolaceae bacterium]